MSLEDLMNVKVTSVSKTPEELGDIASSVYVLTEDDIRRSGSTHLLDVLNMVPGVWMQESSHNLVNFGVRSKIDEFPLSMRVILDGVPIWSPVTGGPMFLYLNMPVEQIERIEVVKGPGGTIYGANANTGVISIFTKTPENSLGNYVKLSAGTQDYLSPFLRFGRKLSDSTYLSCFVSYATTRGYDKTDAFDGKQLDVTAPDGTIVSIQNKFSRDDTDGQEAVNAGGVLQTEISDVIRSTSRFFLSHTKRDAYTIGKIAGLTWVEKDNATDYFISERLDFNLSDTHSAFAHAYFREQNVDAANDGGWNPRAGIFELELQDNVRLGTHALSVGANYNLVAFNNKSGGPESDLTYSNLKENEQLYGAFVQDTISFGKMVDLTMGIKAETWTLASDQVEFSPSIRLSVKPNDDLTFWGAVSKSVTTPGYFHLNMENRIADVSGDGSAFIAIVPADRIKPTKYHTYELGLRTMKIPKTYVDVSLFYSDYKDDIGLDDDFMTKNIEMSKVGDYAILPMFFTNTKKGESYGGEAILKVHPADNVSVELSYSAFFIDFEGQEISGQPGTYYSISDEDSPNTPEHIVRLRKYVDFPSSDVQLMIGLMWSSKSFRGASFNYVTQEEGGINPNNPNDLLKVDFNIEKTWNERASFNVWGRNIFADDYVEYYSQYVASGYPHTVHRTFGCSVSYNF